MTSGEQSRTGSLSKREPSIANVDLHAVIEYRRGNPFENLGVGGQEQHASHRIRDLCKLIENSRPELWDKGAFINPINECSVHHCLPAASQLIARLVHSHVVSLEPRLRIPGKRDQHRQVRLGGERLHDWEIEVGSFRDGGSAPKLERTPHALPFCHSSA